MSVCLHQVVELRRNLHNGGSTYDAFPPIDTAWPTMLISASAEPLVMVRAMDKLRPEKIRAHRLVYPAIFIAIQVTISTAPG
jgi:hypothetical protein